MRHTPWGYILPSQHDWNITFKYCGIGLPSKPGFFVAPHTRLEYLIHYVISGKGFFYCEGKKFELHSSDLFLICPSRIVSYQADPDDPFQLCWFAFDVTNGLKFISLLGFSLEQPVHQLEKSIPLVNMIQKMIDEIVEPIPNEFSIQSYLYSIIAYLINSNKQLSIGSNKVTRNQHRLRYIRLAKAYIELNYMHFITVQDIACNVNLERTYFSKIFKEEENVTIQQYLINVRITQSKALLKQTDYSIKEICTFIGMKDAYYFSKLFKKITKLTPSQYRLTHNKQ